MCFQLYPTAAFTILQPYETVLKGYHGLENSQQFLIDVFACGIFFNVYNELQNKVLGSLGPVPTAVGNTLKRVVIFVALFYLTPGETFPMPKIIGCAIAIAGCLVYAICNSKKI